MISAVFSRGLWNIYKFFCKTKGNIEKMPDCCTCDRACATVIFALRRVILLHSDIRLSPSDICFASFFANIISLQTKCSNITFAQRKYHAERARGISLEIKKYRECKNILCTFSAGGSILLYSRHPISGIFRKCYSITILK